MSVKVLAPAKVNLFLGIGPRREDGYHDAITVLHALSMHDTLTIDVVPEGGFHPAFCVRGAYDLPTVKRNGIDVGVEMVGHEGIEIPEIPVEDNLVAKAVWALAEAAGNDWRGYVRIRVDKHIPMQAGLGGGSTVAAAVLVGLGSIWGIAADDPMLDKVARTLGADVPFFLRGGCAEYVGRGDEFSRDMEPMKDNVVIIMPEGAAVSTAAAYKTFDERPFPLPPEALEDLSWVSEAFECPIFNNLAEATYLLNPALRAVRTWARSQDGVDDTLLAGSGAATFAICDDYPSAQLLAVHAQQKGWTARVTNFSSLRCTVLPQKTVELPDENWQALSKSIGFIS